MQICPIGFYSFKSKSTNKIRPDGQPMVTSEATSPLKTTIPLNKLRSEFFANHTVSFQGAFNLPLNMHNLPCPCCGRIMIPAEEFLSRFTPPALSGSSERAVKFLSAYQGNMHDIEKLAFQKIRQASAITPDKTLQQILLDMRPQSLRELKENQFGVFGQIDELSSHLSSYSATRVKRILRRARRLIEQDDFATPFKRKSLIDDLSTVRDEIPEKGIGQQIYQSAMGLNNSENNLHAFIVKYANRSPREIGQRLVSKSVMSIEHIIPQNPIEGANGANDPKNIILECAGCNNTRGNTPLHEWIKIHPEMIVNIQRHFDEIIERMNSNSILGYEPGLRAVVKTLREQSKGAIIIDTSGLSQGRVGFAPKVASPLRLGNTIFASA